MQFEFNYTRTGNLFHFVSNLTEWHYACRQSYNKNWLIKTGPLTNEEGVVIQTLKPILGKYTFGKKFLGIPFIRATEENVWEEVEKWVGVRSCQSLQEIFDTFGRRFEKIWIEEEPKLKFWKEQLEKATNSQEVEGLIQDLEVFFSVSAKVTKVRVFLLLSPLDTGHGGNANVGEGAITLDCSSTNPDFVNDVLADLWHETIHLVFEQKHLAPLLKNFLGEHGFFIRDSFLGRIIKSPTAILGEAIVGAVIPRGTLAKKYFGLNVERINQKQLGNNYERVKQNPKNFRLWYYFAAQHLDPLIKKYIAAKKPVDTPFLEKTLSIYKKYLSLLDN